MIKQINISLEEHSIEQLQKLKEKIYNDLDIKFVNVKLKLLNKKLKNSFKKNDLFVSAKTLYELMQPTGDRGTHNYHGLTPNEIYRAIKNLNESKYLFKSLDNRYILVTLEIAECGDQIIAIVDTEAPLHLNDDAKINKLVTIYPKRNCENFIKRHLKS